jgi:hypothetical protein
LLNSLSQPWNLVVQRRRISAWNLICIPVSKPKILKKRFCSMQTHIQIYIYIEREMKRERERERGRERESKKIVEVTMIS